MMVELPHSPAASASSIPVHESLAGRLLGCGAQGKAIAKGGKWPIPHPIGGL